MDQTNVDSSVANFSLALACANKQGYNFCVNTAVSLVVANGAHDQSVISAVTALLAANVKLRVFCPDSDEHRGVAYLMPEPSTAPSYTITCSTYLNETDLVKESIVVIVSGPIATHGFLARNEDVISVLQFTGTYSLFGTALVLLLALKSHEDIVYVPYSPFTSADLAIAEYNVTTNSSAVSGVGHVGGSVAFNQFWYRAPSLKRAKVLAGYTSNTNVTQGFASFVSQTIELIVWDASDSTATDDALTVGSWLGVGGLIIAAVFAIKKARTHRKKRNYQAVAAGNDDDSSQARFGEPGGMTRETSIPTVYQ
jgi:hypothetical protein